MTPFERERQARREAERLLEQKARELHERNELLRRQAAELEALKDQAVRASRLKTTFIANMSHELRTPMNAIIGFAEAIAHEDDMATVHRQAKRIIESGTSLQDVLTNILTFSEIDSGSIALTDRQCKIAQDLTNLFDCFSPRAKAKGLAFKLNIDSNTPDLLVLDIEKLKQAVGCLLDNAVRFTQTGSISVTAQARPAAHGWTLAITVADTGPGVPYDRQTQIFESFEQSDTSTKRAHGGVGLGLPLAKGLAIAMGGDIALQSEPSAGAAFTLTVAARCATERRQTSRTASQVEAPCAQDWSALIVDDNPVNRMILRVAIEKSDKRCTEAGNGLEALEILAAGAPVDVVLLDMHMPTLNGWETIERIRNAAHPWRDVPVIAVTADQSLAQEPAYSALGFDGFVAKAVKRDVLFSEIKRVIESAHKRQHSQPAALGSSSRANRT